MEISAAARKRLETQGYLGMDGASLGRIKYWLRLTPAICMSWTVLGTLLQSPAVLWTFVALALGGAILPVNPFDSFYHYALRHLFKSPRLPRFPAPRRFSCLLAATMVSVSAWSVQSGFFMPAYIIGAIALLVGLLQVSMGICIPAIIYGLIFRKPLTCSV